ncbi:MAG: hypothetical protein A3D31_07900 [Candidatus Fluviicola riflensis]|nr:MAG: hypothetical protein CHH17_07110 [Candidatus Fluviicola riflensis]OGS79866.1 MAG: hypothetical protein A3D31_07900 [Candidatus Fluviicola riflensis]OGS82381.1 MAG: hypothetical protein A2724_16845 [Fluviicola sp. RIFCSPHIGHO2_01_FULL_43_53]OGS88045.1 MAG: hypothetical protein A3E30_14280 [Fluviicola sp. RIFCSPHIGHO2_12_FULL_43_24]
MRILTFLFLGITVTANGQKSSAFQLEEIMKGDGFIGHSPENIRWSFDGQTILFDWNPSNTFGNTPYIYNLSDGTSKTLPVNTITVSAAPIGTKIVGQYYFQHMGNLMRYNPGSKQTEPVVSTKNRIRLSETVSNLRHVYFEQENNLFFFNETVGGITQVTDFVQGKLPEKQDSTSLMRQQTELFSYIRLEQQRAEWQEKNQAKRKLPKTIYYDRNEQLEDLRISPDEQFVTFRLSNYPEDPETHVEEYISTSGYTNRQSARAKVSNNDPSHRLGIYDREHDSVYYVSFSSLTDIRKKPDYLSEYGDTNPLYEKDRSVIMHAPVMHPKGKLALVDVRSHDNKDRWIVLLDLAKGTIRELEHQHDEAWIGGPGISGWNEAAGTLGWLDDQSFYFQSEVSGYSHLYSMNTGTGVTKQWTSGNWEVYDVILNKTGETFYIIANKLHPGVRNGYKIAVKTNELTPLFEGYFGIEWSLSPDEKKWAIRYSTSTQPWELYVADNKPNAFMRRVTTSTYKGFNELKLQAPEVIQIPTSDNKTVTARLYKPTESNGAAVMFVHGAGYLQNAHHYWSYYTREFLFHQLLITKGYTVLDIDYRASEGYGRDVRTAVYRHMGERDLLDYVDGKSFLVKNHGIDANRVGIYGGSYGGFITLMGMLKTPGTFACGAGLRSVTDWEHYNHEYTSNILNYPGTDPKAYRRSSPIYYAEGLSGPLLLLHGIEDDNVQFQDIVRLNQRFIELGKSNYQLAVFPTETHGFKSTVAWTDEYRRILELFELHLK